MFYTVMTQIIDNDPKGQFGGTQYKITISKGKEIIEFHNYSIMDLVIGSFNPDVIKNKYIKLNNELLLRRDKELADSIKLAKAESLSNKMSNVNHQLIAVIDDVIASNAALVDQYRDGNTKVLNALVGQTMKKHKGDPVVIKQLLMEKIK